MSTAETPVVVLKLFHHTAISVVRTLGRLGAPVIGVHHDLRAPAARSRHLREVVEWDLDTAPEAESVAMLLRLAERLGARPVLVATDDATGELVAANAHALRSAFLFPEQPADLPRRLYSKRGMHDLCREHDVPTPLAGFPQTREEGHELIGRAVFPLVLKPVDSAAFVRRNGIPMLIAEDAAEALEAYDRLEDFAAPNIMLQEYIPGDSSTVWVFTGYFDRDSELVFGVGGAKLRQYPVHTGTTCYGIVRSNPPMEAVVRRFAKALGYRGVFDCGFRHDHRDGTYKLLDVNPRVGANFRQCVGRGGLDVVQAMYLDLLGREVPHDVPDEGRIWWVENYDLLSALWRMRHRTMTPRRWLGSLRAVDEPAWFARDDLRPFAAMCVRTAAIAAHKALPLGRVPGAERPSL